MMIFFYESLGQLAIKYIAVANQWEMTFDYLMQPLVKSSLETIRGTKGSFFYRATDFFIVFF